MLGRLAALGHWTQRWTVVIKKQRHRRQQRRSGRGGEAGLALDHHCGCRGQSFTSSTSLSQGVKFDSMGFKGYASCDLGRSGEI